ncbi:MAG: helix-turn-helix transcriptional regulator [Gloeobacterales cyanobacterium]
MLFSLLGARRWTSRPRQLSFHRAPLTMDTRRGYVNSRQGSFCDVGEPCTLDENVLVARILIKWRLNELMARKRMTNAKLAALINKHPKSVSRLRSTDEMPRTDGKELDNLCKALECTPSDLIEYTPANEGVEK